jgi:hypothetical protein
MAKKTLEQIVAHSKAAWGVGELLSRIASNQFAEMRIERSYNNKIKKLQAERDAIVLRKQEKRMELAQQMLTMLMDRRGAFVEGLKSIAYAIGKVGFRNMKPAVEIEEGLTEKDVVSAFLRRHRKYLNVKYTLNKKKLAKDFENGEFKSLRGICIRQGEEFFISVNPRKDGETPEVISIPVPKE